MKEPLKRLDVWCKMARCAFVLLYLMARSYSSESRQFPQLIAMFTLVAWDPWHVIFERRQHPQPKGSDAGFQVADQRRGTRIGKEDST